MIEIIFYLIGGIVLLYLGGEGLVRGSSALALRMGISPLIIGLTVVSFGTSSPELMVSLKAALRGNSSIAVGNVVGSNIANIALIIGISALIRPIDIHANVIKREIPIMITISLILLIFLLDQKLSFVEGFTFVLLLAAYILLNIFLSGRENKEIESEFENLLISRVKIPISLFMIIAGIIFLFFGADIFLKGAVALARVFNLSDAIIGLSLIAVGTSLPELTTSIVASVKKESDILIGNAVGSNIFNILSILGITALILPLSSEGINKIDLIIMIAAAVVLLPLSYSKFRVSRLEGFLLVVAYSFYIIYLFNTKSF